MLAAGNPVSTGAFCFVKGSISPLQNGCRAKRWVRIKGCHANRNGRITCLPFEFNLAAGD